MCPAIRFVEKTGFELRCGGCHSDRVMIRLSPDGVWDLLCRTCGRRARDVTAEVRKTVDVELAGLPTVGVGGEEVVPPEPAEAR